MAKTRQQVLSESRWILVPRELATLNEGQLRRHLARFLDAHRYEWHEGEAKVFNAYTDSIRKLLGVGPA